MSTFILLKINGTKYRIDGSLLSIYSCIVAPMMLFKNNKEMYEIERIGDAYRVLHKKVGPFESYTEVSRSEEHHSKDVLIRRFFKADDEGGLQWH